MIVQSIKTTIVTLLMSLALIITLDCPMATENAQKIQEIQSTINAEKQHLKIYTDRLERTQAKPNSSELIQSMLNKKIAESNKKIKELEDQLQDLSAPVATEEPENLEKDLPKPLAKPSWMTDKPSRKSPQDEDTRRNLDEKKPTSPYETKPEPMPLVQDQPNAENAQKIMDIQKTLDLEKEKLQTNTSKLEREKNKENPAQWIQNMITKQIEANSQKIKALEGQLQELGAPVATEVVNPTEETPEKKDSPSEEPKEPEASPKLSLNRPSWVKNTPSGPRPHNQDAGKTLQAEKGAPAVKLNPEPTPLVQDSPKIETQPTRQNITTEAPECTKILCSNPVNMLICIKNYDTETNKISDCLKAKPKIKNVNDANNYGSIEKLRLEKDIYLNYPDTKYWIDQTTDNQGNPVTKRSYGDSPLQEKEKIGLKYALDAMTKKCDDISSNLTKVTKARKLSTYKSIMDQINQVQRLNTELSDKTTRISRMINSNADISIKNLKGSVDDTTLDFKNCIQQGSGVLYSAKNDDFKSREIKACKADCTDESCSNVNKLSLFQRCSHNCSIPKYVNKCNAIAKKCPKGGDTNINTCMSVYNINEAKVTAENECAQVCEPTQCTTKEKFDNCVDKCHKVSLELVNVCEKAFDKTKK